MIAPSLLVRRLSLAIAIAIACAYTASLTAQIPTRNVNMVSGLVWPLGDPFLQRQNEPSMAASTRNPMHLLAGSNDYRSVDLPIVLSDVDGEVGDAWLGLYKSTDGGERWTSTLLPGYPHDPSLEGQTSPIRGYHAAARSGGARRHQWTDLLRGSRLRSHSGWFAAGQERDLRVAFYRQQQPGSRRSDRIHQHVARLQQPGRRHQRVSRQTVDGG